MPLRRHQVLALDALAKAWSGGRTRSLVVLPPGAGKTLVGLESVRRLLAAGTVGRAVVLGPNTAIQGQWATAARDLGLETGTSRDLATTFTALTYQSLAVFDPDDEVDGEGEEASGGLLSTLHDNGKELVARLRAAGPILLVLDECHHLLEVWGRLLGELLDELPEAHVLGLTATPAEVLTADQAALVAGMFGAPVFTSSIPAVVREGDLAPFAELVWLTEPTAAEQDWLAEGAERFRELTTQLTDPTFGSTAFLPWLDLRFVVRPGADPSWSALVKAEPLLCDAALRMHHAGLLALPPGARLGEEHRREPTVDDWMLLVDDWLRTAVGPSEAAQDRAVVEAVRRVLPAVGFVRTRHGIRRGRTPVDRVLARSESKTTAAVQIVEQERAELGDGARTLLLCDHERASATLPVDLEGVITAQSGSARAVLAALLESPTVSDALLVTGRTVAGGRDTLARLTEHVRATDAALAASLTVDDEDELSCLVGPWQSRDWVAHVTSFFEGGGCHALVGTRGLLGEGWDARRVTGLVDLTAITTTTAVVQTRGRALRTDPEWAQKVALNWSVVCVAQGHPRGDNDWQRLVRKHTGFFGADTDGEVVDGVGHLDQVFSPFVPPPTEAFDAVNARMLVRAQDRPAVRERWRIGTPYDDRPAMTVRIRPDQPGRLGDSVVPPTVVQGPDALEVRRPREGQRSLRAAQAGGVLVVAAALGATGPVSALGALLVALVGLLVVTGAGLTRSAREGRALIAETAQEPSIARIASAVADGLHAAGLSPVGAEGVRVTLDPDGQYRCRLDGVTEPVSRIFADALDEAVSPLVTPRYVLPRWVASPLKPSVRHSLAAGLGRPVAPAYCVWHAVPTVLGVNAGRATAYATAWAHWVGGGAAVFTGSPEGAGVLAAQAGSDPFEVSTTMRRTWS